MKKDLKIAVIGGTGKSGRYLVRQLIKQNYDFKVLVRNPENFSASHPRVEVVHGSVSDYHTVQALLQGVEVVISTLGMGNPPGPPTIFTTSTTNLIKAMKENNIERYIVTTGLNVDTPSDNKGPKSRMATQWMQEHFPESTADKQKEYELLSASGLNWTLVRLPVITLTDGRFKLAVSLEDCPGDTISAPDLAHFLIEQLNDKTYLQKAPFVANI